MVTAIKQTAIKYLASGLCALPANVAEKRPVGLSSWSEFQNHLPTREQLEDWYLDQRADGVCVIGGAVSAHLETIDFDLMAEFFSVWRDLVESQARGLVSRLLIERSQSGGKHVIYRCPNGVGGSVKLAQREIECGSGEKYLYNGKEITPQLRVDKWIATLTFIETKAEGGVFLCFPSPGYIIEQGSFDAIPTVTAEEREIMISAAKLLNEVVRKVVDYSTSSPVGDRPGDEFNRRGDVRPFLEDKGWVLVRNGGAEYWRRPGKGRGWSARFKDGLFCVYTCNAAPFEEKAGYSPFRVYALLEHGGDFAAAAKALADQGYGGPPALPRKHANDNQSVASEQAITAPASARDAKSGRWILHPAQTVPTANAYIAEFHKHPDGRTLHCFGEILFEWRDGSYREVEEAAVKKKIQNWLHGCLKYDRHGALEAFNSNPTTVKAAITTLKAQAHLPITTPLPSWLDAPTAGVESSDIVACKTKLLHLPTKNLLPATPRFFTTSALEFDPDFSAPFPKRWGQFLHELFDGDQESWDLLQEWFGYCLTADMSQQKMLLIVGPKRSGKGTIFRVLSRLVGDMNQCGPTVSSLAGPFGLQPLIGKTLAVVSDARFHGENMMTVVERLLCISGEDLITIDRKHLPSLHMRLMTRFLFLTNEFPRFTDASAALASRFMVLQLRNSFYGREDPQLTERLHAEIPSILNWAIAGWMRLRERGCFHMPQASLEAVQELEELSSPVSAFVRDRCIVGSNHREESSRLYEAWVTWCAGEGRTHPGTRPGFCRDLSAAVPTISRRRGSGNFPFYEGIALRTVS